VSEPSTIRFGITRIELIRWPRSESAAGSSVIAASTDTAGISMPAMPIDRITGIGMITIENRPIATVEPDTTTDRPACFIVSIVAVSGSPPWRSSSRKRKIISSA